MPRPNGSTFSKQTHVVLIPGFGGFDALGNVKYYSGVTKLFWERKSEFPNAVLRYFDNLPTAAVATRAMRLELYLASRIARGEIRPNAGDEIVLVGHSTGGLDIRQLILNLAKKPDHENITDNGVRITSREILDCLHRVVFLSVPHWGTNIADWVRSHSFLRRALVEQMRLAVGASQVYPIDFVEKSLAEAAACITDANFFLAVQDCLTEANEHYGAHNPTRTAAAHEAAANLELYLRDIASDFHIIDDLTSQPHKGRPISPAHFSAEIRAQELKVWRDQRIKALSFATVGHRPFSFAHGTRVAALDFANFFTYPQLLRQSGAAAGTDIAYRLCYLACAGGPFPPWLDSAKMRSLRADIPAFDLEFWDNDGIVNTLSMMWPIGKNHLVTGDHLDIVGHFQLVDARPPDEGRKYQTYDTLRSASHFTQEKFEEVWSAAFSFATQTTARGASGA